MSAVELAARACYEQLLLSLHEAMAEDREPGVDITVETKAVPTSDKPSAEGTATVRAILRRARDMLTETMPEYPLRLHGGGVWYPSVLLDESEAPTFVLQITMRWEDQPEAPA